MAGLDIATLLPLMMGGGKNLNPQDLMAMMMQTGGGQAGKSAPPPPQNGNMQSQMMMQMMMQMMNRPKPVPPVGFRPIEGICPVMTLLKRMLRR